MATKLTGMITLSRIDKSVIKKLDNGDLVLYVDITKRREVSPAGYTHVVSYYDKAQGERIYIGNLKEQEYGEREDLPSNDLPF